MSQLPTVAQAQEALALINTGREAIGLDPVARFDFDGSTPGSTSNCLSARHLFDLAGITVTGVALQPGARHDPAQTQALFNAIGARTSVYIGAVGRATRIPMAIRVLTDPFDDEVDGLRERLVEAGVV